MSAESLLFRIPFERTELGLRNAFFGCGFKKEIQKDDHNTK
jgi:hypothetical protein